MVLDPITGSERLTNKPTYNKKKSGTKKSNRHRGSKKTEKNAAKTEEDSVRGSK